MSAKTKALRIIPLTDTEASALQEHELIISQGLSAFVAVGQALISIRDDKLYRTEYKTFEEYCKKRWRFTDRRARQLIEATEVAEEIGTSGSGLVIENERQARALAMVPPHLRKEIAERLAADELEPTEQNVTKAVNKLLEEKRAEQKERETAGSDEDEDEEADETEDAEEETEEAEEETPRERAIRGAAKRCEKERMYLARGLEHLRLALKDLRKVRLSDFATAEAIRAGREGLDAADEVFSDVRGHITEAEKDTAAWGRRSRSGLQF